MSKTDRLAYYFKTLGPEVLVTHKEIVDLLWRGCPDGGPLNVGNSIAVLIKKIRKKSKKYDLEGYRFDVYKTVGYTMVKEVRNG